MNYQFQKSIFFIVFLLCTFTVTSQKNNSISEIIGKIYELEKDKDPKCYATANRLEDFMYGTPLEEDTRNLKIDIQKELIYYLKERGTQAAKEVNLSKITVNQLHPILQDIADYSQNKNGDYVYKLTTGTVTIAKKDYDQYASVSYGYRSLLSVEQDLVYFSDSKLLSFDKDALQLANDYVNLITLVTLKIADINARKANEATITKKRLKDTWVLILNESKNNNTLANISYPKTVANSISETEEHNLLVKEIIKQKISSYEKYNKLNENVFLRNVQVYFARQKWPKDNDTSNKLRSYYLESLISFTSSLLEVSDKNATNIKSHIIRVSEVQKALHSFLPSTTNTFEDVSFFPLSTAEEITIESYDLDAFRDSGFHWRILGYAIDDLKTKKIKNLDPNAAEQLVEGIAQMGVLVLRIAGEQSHLENKKALDSDDITFGFNKIQNLINNYDFNAKIELTTEITSSSKSTDSLRSFELINTKTQLKFEHKSSDWLNRLIRSYTTSEAEGVVKLAIPPAFGGSGVACEDINNDGLADVLLLGGFGVKLFLNSKEGIFTDITKQSGIDTYDKTLFSYEEVRQPIVADFNNDGLQDIFISVVNNQHKMYKNLDGQHFKDESAFSNLGGTHLVGGPATAFDYNNDGLLDVYIGYFGNYIEGTLPTLSRDNQNGSQNKLYKNLGNFLFEEVEFTKDQSSNNGWTQALGHSDLNQDGFQDLIIGNDFGQNKYYYNDGKGLFNEVSKKIGTDKPSYTMNVGITDLNGDLFPDLYISNIVVMQKDEKYVSPNVDTKMKFDPKKMANIRTVEANDLFLSNVGKDESLSYKLSTNVGRGYSATGWSWDADFFDFDNDGDEDLYVLNGMNDFSVYSSENPFYFERAEASKSIEYAESNRERNVFFVNEGGQLIDKAKELGVDLNSNARSASYFDYDNDGDLDIIINNYHESASFLENKSSNSNNWIKIKLIGNPSERVNRDAIGSTIILKKSKKEKVWREIHSTTGYLSVHPKEQHFGLGSKKEVDVAIRWSNGQTFEIENLNANTVYEITYPNELNKKN